MPEVAYATLGVIPSVRGLRAELEKQTSTFDQAGRAGGRRYGDAVAAGAGSRIKTSLKAALAPAAGILAGLGGARIFGDMIAEAQEAAKVGRITEQLIKSTGGSANLSAAQVGNLATSLSKYAAVDDELIQAGANVMLTFRNVRDEAGKGNDIFDRATKAALDLSTVLGTDMKSSALQLGKALNDPVRGLMMLGRAGVQFSESQKAQIKNLVANNNLLGAQKVILDEVERQVGGAAGANATALDKLGVSFKNLEEAAGTAVAPALDKVATVTADDLIPALQGAGGLVGDLGRAFGSLPPEVQAATGAMIAFNVARATGVTGFAKDGVQTLASGLDTVRLRAMLAADSYRTLRAGQMEVVNGSGRFTPAVGRMSAALGALRTGAAGAGAGLKAGLTGALNLVGGPWGIALAAGTVALTHFWSEHQKAKQYVEDLTNSLDEQDGTITKLTKDTLFKSFQDSGVIDAAKEMGLSLDVLKDAALGSQPALDAYRAHVDAIRASLSDVGAAGANDPNLAKLGSAMSTVEKAIGGQNSALKEARSVLKDHSAFMGEDAVVQAQVTQATQTYTSKIDAARAAVQKLLDVENKRRNANLSIFQSRTAIARAVDEARKEAADGPKTLDAATEAGRKNRDALASVADAWNSAGNSVKNAKGAYDDMRTRFERLAVNMGASKDEAKKLANNLLQVPKKTPAEITTPGMKKALRELAELRAQLEAIHNFKGARVVISAQATKNRGALADIQGRATGGPIYGPGTGTSDSILIRASNGEFMQRKAAVDYYGVDFMRRLNALQVPKYAQGGPVGQVTSAPLGSEVIGKLRIVGDVGYLEGVARPAETSNRRLSALDGIPR